MKVFLTGGTGYLGGAVARALLKRGHQVAALARRMPEARESVVWHRGDLSDPKTWREPLQDCQAVIHTAAMVKGWGDANQFNSINIEATLQLIQEATQAGVHKIVVVGSLFALGPSTGQPLTETSLDRAPGPLNRANHYVRTKTEVSRRVRQLQLKGSPVMQAFPTILFGPGPLTPGNHLANVLTNLAAGKFPGMVGDGSQLWNLVGVQDAALGVVQVLEQGGPGDNYILGGEDWAQEKLVRESAKLIGVKVPGRKLGSKLPHTIAGGSELWAKLTGTEPFLTHGEVSLYNQSWSFSSQRAEQDLGYTARPVADVLQETVEWLRGSVWSR